MKIEIETTKTIGKKRYFNRIFLSPGFFACTKQKPGCNI